jgi:hypothetical protein
LWDGGGGGKRADDVRPVGSVDRRGGGFEPVGPPRCHTAIASSFNDRAGTIHAGTNEIQRNIMAKAVPGL